MTLEGWIDELRYGDLDRIKDRLDAIELLEFMKELKRHREFIDHFCIKSNTVSECCACRAYDYGICTDKDLARKCRERGEDGSEQQNQIT